jgi:hypothetical protein
MRMDNRENEFDSGIRVTCAYHLVPPPLNPNFEKKNNEKIAQLYYSTIGTPGLTPVAPGLGSFTPGSDGGDLNEDIVNDDNDNSSDNNEDNNNDDNNNNNNDTSSPPTTIPNNNSINKIDVEHDQLILHQSVKVSNARSISKSDYFVIYYFIHGK